MRIGLLGDKNSANTKNWIKGLKNAGAEVICWSMPRRSLAGKFLFFLLDVIHLFRWLKREKPAIIIGYRTTSYGFLGALTGFKPLVIAAQAIDDVSPPGHWTNVLTAQFAKFAIKNADLIHAWAPNMVPAMKARGANDDKLLVLPRGIDLSIFQYRKNEFDKSVNLIVTRSLFPEYHIDIILEAVAVLFYTHKYKNLQLTIVGDGPLMQNLKKLTKKLQIKEQVRFVGRVPEKEIPFYLSQHNYYISLPDTEGASASLFEAFACGLFPIVTDLPANRVWIKHRDNGLLVQRMDKDSLVENLLEALSNPENNLVATIKNRKIAEDYLCLSDNMKVFIARYNKLIEATYRNESKALS